MTFAIDERAEALLERFLAEQRLLGSGAKFQMSCAAAATPELHAKICASIEAGIERLNAASAATSQTSKD